MLQANIKKHTFHFNTPGGTSRGVLHTKDSWYLSIWNNDNSAIVGVGECSILPKLSIDDKPNIEDKLNEVAAQINDYASNYHQSLLEWPAIRFALEMALLDLKNGGKRLIYASPFALQQKPIAINGLIWMGDIGYMKSQLSEKLKQGFSCIKIKVGAINFDDEVNLIKEIRKSFSPNQIEIRVDANGAFSPEDAIRKLQILSELDLHSIEQPIKAGQWTNMAKLCANTPLPIALDEELIGVNTVEEKRQVLETIKPQYIILKPSLVGGFRASEEWVTLAEEFSVNWWATSALEGNIGLNAIAQWTASKNTNMPQGLGTGQVFSNNIDSPLQVEDGALIYNQSLKWGNL
ncbi:enolase C-terminal domain-like protein [Saccharicrinis aurantiacus]|uniref:enolase C-terminal domain-like protein n=1 Tax=Saccharicrinis aurantiacus TaxID=1849719 RepID=UPI00094F873B|nr:enolase C-terminal domain-like protein [Saccharicrinis aurantiacus]